MSIKLVLLHVLTPVTLLTLFKMLMFAKNYPKMNCNALQTSKHSVLQHHLSIFSSIKAYFSRPACNSEYVTDRKRRLT